MARRGNRWRVLVVVAGAFGLAVAGPARAQGGNSLFERLNLDRLRLSAIGVSYGSINPSQMVATQSYSIFADYGEIVTNWRVVFTASYWDTRYTDGVVRDFTVRFRENLVDPSGDDTLRVSTITMSDISLGADVRYTPRRTGAIRPYFGGGGGAHVLNAEGKYIENTFVEAWLDNIAAGFSGVAGLDAIIGRRITVGLQARYELLSGTGYGSIRAAGSYLFDRVPPSRR